jgi:hypothetical protein
MINNDYEAIGTSSISSFMTWAADRIEKEFLENEKVARESGGIDFMPSPKNVQGRKVVTKEKLHIIKSIEEMKKEGQTIKYGCEQMGIHYCTFGRWKALLKEKGLL